MKANSLTIALIALWLISTTALGVLWFQERQARISYEKASSNVLEKRYNELESKYDSAYTGLTKSIQAINDTLEIAGLRHSTQMNAIYYTLSVNQRNYEKLNDQLVHISNDSLLLLLTEQLSEIDTAQSR